MIEKRLFNIAETMEYLNVSRNTIVRLMGEGKLVNVSISRSFMFDRQDIDNLIQTQKKTLDLKAS